MAIKVYDLAVAVRSYTDKDGEKKNVYEQVGSVMQNDKGGKFLVIKRTFNPAGVPQRLDQNGVPSNSDTIMVSMFEPKQKDEPPASPIHQRQRPNTKNDVAQQNLDQSVSDDQIPW
jgi:hypothetical protein